MRRFRRFMMASGFVLFCAVLGGCAINPVTGQSELMLLSEQEERQLGFQAEKSVTEEYGVYADSALQGYVQGVALPLGKVQVRLALGAPSVGEPKRRAPVAATMSRAKVSPADMQPASMMQATGFGMPAILPWSTWS